MCLDLTLMFQKQDSTFDFMFCCVLRAYDYVHLDSVDIFLFALRHPSSGRFVAYHTGCLQLSVRKDGKP